MTQPFPADFIRFNSNKGNQQSKTILERFYLWNSSEAELLREDGVIGQLDGLADGLVNAAVAEVDLGHVEREIGIGDHGVHGERDRAGLKNAME